MTVPQQAEAYRADLAALADEAASEVWLAIGAATTAAAIGSALTDNLEAILDEFMVSAAAVAADWYAGLRLDAGIPDVYEPPLAMPDRGADAMRGWLLDSPRLPDGALDLATIRARTEVAALQRVESAANQTVMDAATQDDQARGWQRVGVGACDFCAILISRGAVYSKAAVRFGAHDHCRCSAMPAFGGRALPVKPYTPSDRNISDADRARVRAWLRDNS